MGVGVYQPSPALMQFLGDNEPFSMSNQAIIGQRKLLSKKRKKGQKG
jgi:hypothetical protein